MMFKFTTMYRRVDDENKLESFFANVHLPLAEQLPGLLHSEISRVTGKPGGQSRFHLIYELYFDTEAQFQLSLISPEGKQLIAALKPWADARLITWFFSDAYEESHTPWQLDDLEEE